MTTAEIILRVRKKVPLLLLATIVTFGLSYVFFTRAFVTFKSDTSFYINENVVLTMGMGHIDAQELNVLTTMATNKVLLLISSDELRDSIIKDFDLYKHYGIKEGEQFARETVMYRLNRRVTVRREPNSVSLVRLTVEDMDRFLAADMANKIVERVNMMNKEIMKSDLNKRALQYENQLPSLKDKAADTRKEFLFFVDSVSPSISKQNQEREGLPTRYRMIASDLVGKMDKSSTKYDEMQEAYYNIMGKVKTVGNDQWQCVTTVKKALPDITSWNSMVLIYALGTSAMALLFYISVMVYFYQNQDQMELIELAIKGKGPAK